MPVEEAHLACVGITMERLTCSQLQDEHHKPVQLENVKEFHNPGMSPNCSQDFDLKPKSNGPRTISTEDLNRDSASRLTLKTTKDLSICAIH